MKKKENQRHYDEFLILLWYLMFEFSAAAEQKHALHHYALSYWKNIR